MLRALPSLIKASALTKAALPLAALALVAVAPPAQAQAQAQAQERPAILVSTFADPNGTGAAPELRQQFEIALARTKRLTVVSTQRESDPQGDAAAGASGKSPSPAPGYFITGSINFAERRPSPAAETLSAIMPGLCAPDRYTLSIDMVVKSLRTLEVAHAKSTQVSVKVPCGAPDTASAAQTAVTQIAQMAARDLVTSIYPISVIRAQPGGTVLLDYGEAVLPVGTYLELFGPSEVITIRGERMTVDGPLLGRWRVTMAAPDAVEAAYEGEGSLKVPAGAVVRIDDNQSATKKPKGRKP